MRSSGRQTSARGSGPIPPPGILAWSSSRSWCPKASMRDPKAAKGLAKALDPLVRAVDGLVGEKVAMLVEVENGEKVAAGLFVHDKLSESVGTCTAAFATCMLAGEDAARRLVSGAGRGDPQPGAAPEARQPRCKAKCYSTRALYQLQNDPVQLGFGIYFE